MIIFGPTHQSFLIMVLLLSSITLSSLALIVGEKNVNSIAMSQAFSQFLRVFRVLSGSEQDYRGHNNPLAEYPDVTIASGKEATCAGRLQKSSLASLLQAHLLVLLIIEPEKAPSRTRMYTHALSPFLWLPTLVLSNTTFFVADFLFHRKVWLLATLCGFILCFPSLFPLTSMQGLGAMETVMILDIASLALLPFRPFQQ